MKHFRDGFARELDDELVELERFELFEPPRYCFKVSRRAFLGIVGGGLLFVGLVQPSAAQRSRGGSDPVEARLHLDENGVFTVFTSKVEVGQGARTQLALAAAEELRVDPANVRMVMADTDVVPNDGGTYGSLTTPRTVPAVRSAAAAAREALVQFACEQWKLDADGATVAEGTIRRGDRSITYGELAKSAGQSDLFGEATPSDADVTARDAWQVLGRDHLLPTAADIATGKHQYPSDIRRPGMLYGSVLRPPSLTSELKGVDVPEQTREDGAVIVSDDGFVGCAAPTSQQARAIVAQIAETAQWQSGSHPSSETLNNYLRLNTGGGSGRRGPRSYEDGDPDAAFDAASHVFQASYSIPYIQHVPMEPRAAVAEWDGDKLTVWTATQRPHGVQSELAQAFGISDDKVRVIVPDSGGAFGGKHTGETAIEAARLAKGAGKPVSLQWTRAEEFTWAYFRPAGLMDIRAVLGGDGKLTAWEYTNFNSGGSGLESPYTVPNTRHQYTPCNSPLREGSYRALASTGNHFARECAMDELAALANINPLEFRLKHLEPGRIRDVLVAAAEKFGWDRTKQDGRGIGIACGTEKSSYVATAAEVSVRPSDGKITIHRLVQTYECGAIQNPVNLRAQVHGSIIMGLGGALFEHIEFEDGRITNGSLTNYRVPRFKDVPPMEIHLLDRQDLESVGAGETPIITVAPAIANAVFDATGERLRELPLAPTPA
jgi:CO/xanthine dehydrogenase Mo-binding subunit